MRHFICIVSFLFFASSTFAQSDSIFAKELSGVVVTGQYKPQSLHNSVYQIRTIGSERIRATGATTIQQVLVQQTGFRFSNDNTLGTSDVQLMGMNGRNVKILLDGVPLSDRGDTRESLGQIDLNTIDHIEIVEGPLSVSYGSDALAGVINLITKKTPAASTSLTARVQEETAGDEYHPFNYKGSHEQALNFSKRSGNWNFSAGGSHTEFDGYGGDAYGRAKSWRPREQWFGNGKLGYSHNHFNIYYRLDGLHENISDRGAINLQNLKATDKYYISDRFLHQVQTQWSINHDLQLSGLASYTDYQRRTKTIQHDFENGEEYLGTNAGEQDVSSLKSVTVRTLLNYRADQKLSFQPGVDINYERASGERILGSPSITDAALFVSSEWKPNSSINLRPGLRFIHNSAYEAPPVVPSLNTRFSLGHNIDLRIAYAYGFRAPALRELYFSFHDANHDIDGNPDLKAEHSNSFNASFNWFKKMQTGQVNVTAGGFYNEFRNQIDLVQGTSSSGTLVYSYFNVYRAQTTGGTAEVRFSGKKLSASVGGSYIGFASTSFNDTNYVKTDTRSFLWSPEVTSTVSYSISKWNTIISLFYKYTGRKPSFNFGSDNSGHDIVYLASTAAFHMADLTFNSRLNRMITINGGVRNLFDVKDINSTVEASAHNSGGPTPVGYGRSYFLGLNFQWNK